MGAIFDSTLCMLEKGTLLISWKVPHLFLFSVQLMANACLLQSTMQADANKCIMRKGQIAKLRLKAQVVTL